MTALTGRVRILADAAAVGLEIQAVERLSADSLEWAAQGCSVSGPDSSSSRCWCVGTLDGAPNDSRLRDPPAIGVFPRQAAARTRLRPGE